MRRYKGLLIVVMLMGLMSVLYSGLRIIQQADQVLVVTHQTDYDLLVGTSAKSLADDLAHRGWIRSPFWFYCWLRLNGKSEHLKAGLYQITPGMTSAQMVERFISGQVRRFSITLVEGMTVSQILQVVDKAPWVEHQLKNHNPNTLLKALQITQYSSPEGLLYPDTYYYHAHTTDIEILIRAYQRLEYILQQAWTQRAPKLPYKNAYQALIMASIVEKETGVVQERSRIAGVFVRRLAKNMRLQTDPTVIYGMQDKYRGRLTTRDLRQYTPYNTYLIKGLPPTPIAAAGKAAIEAALHPDKGHTLYFVAKGDGTHYFSRTLQEHNRAVARYQMHRRNNYRSSPTITQ